MALALAFGIGVVAGLRSLVPPAVMSWAARFAWLDLHDSWLAFLGAASAPFVATALSLAELVGDKLPITPSRTFPGPFAARVIVGALSGAALCTAARHSPIAGAVLGALGGTVGTLGGYQARTRLVKALRVPDTVIALLEDAVAIGTALLLVSRANGI